MFNVKFTKSIVLFVALCGVGVAGISAVSDPWAKMPAVPYQYYKVRLDSAKKILSDDESLEFIQSVLEKPEMLVGDYALLGKLELLFARADTIQSLKAVQEDIIDDETKELVGRWLNDHSLLKDRTEFMRAKNIIKRIEVLRELDLIKNSVRDPETVKLIDEWIKNPTLLDDPARRNKARVIKRRIKMVKDLLKILDDIRDPESKKLVNSWLINTVLLDDRSNYSHALQIISRVDLVLQLVSLQSDVENPEDKKKVENWLANTVLLDDPVERDLADDVVMRAAERSRLNTLSKLKRNKTAAIIFYTIYRKMTFVRELDRGEGLGYAQSMVNALAMIGYFGTEMFQMFLEAGGEPFTMLASCVTRPNFLGGIVGTAGAIARDEASSYINREIGKECRDKFKEKFPSGVKSTKQERKQLYEEAKTSISDRVRNEGCPGMDLDFFSAFDAYLDRLLERRVDRVLESVHIPSLIRSVWKNKIIGFTRKMFLFKIAPPSIYWIGKRALQGKDVAGEYFGFVPLKEGVKSIAYSLRGKLESEIVNFMNGKTNSDGKGLLDITKEHTFGIFGPPLVPFLLRLSVPYVVLSLTSKLKKDFLTKRDLGLEDPNWKRSVTHKSISYVSERVLIHFLVRIFKKIRPGIVSWSGDKLKELMYFLSRRGLISPSIPETFDQLSQQPHMAQPLHMFIATIFFSLYNVYRSSVSTSQKSVNDYDLIEAYAETMKTGDAFRIVDYILAAWIARWVGNEIADWGISKLDDAKVF
jgi:hypothetical protein